MVDLDITSPPTNTTTTFTNTDLNSKADALFDEIQSPSFFTKISVDMFDFFGIETDTKSSFFN